MDELIFVVQTQDSEDLGRVALNRDELAQFLVVRDSTRIFIQRRYSP